MSDANLFSGQFTVSDINHMKYERVARLSGNTDNGDTSIQLDVNIEVFPCAVGDHLQLLLASSLALDGGEKDSKGWKDVQKGDPSLADDFDYVCHGKVYRFEEGEAENM